MLAVRGDQLSAPGTPRWVMRGAFASFVPPRILRRLSKVYSPPAVFRAVRQHVATMLPVNNLEAVQRGWIDAERLRSAIQTFTNGGGQTGGDILAVVQLERWLQARQSRFANPTRKEVK